MAIDAADDLGVDSRRGADPLPLIPGLPGHLSLEDWLSRLVLTSHMQFPH